MDVLLVIDVQRGVFATPRFEADAVLSRINRLILEIRRRQGVAIFIQHDGAVNEKLAPFSEGWAFLPELSVLENDPIIRKTACDAFWKTALHEKLDSLQPDRLLVCGAATDYCVDATVKGAAARGFPVTVVADAHTTSDRTSVSAPDLIQHYNRLWTNWIQPDSPIRVEPGNTLWN